LKRSPYDYNHLPARFATELLDFCRFFGARGNETLGGRLGRAVAKNRELKSATDSVRVDAALQRSLFDNQEEAIS
jgi:hypothetical protein